MSYQHVQASPLLLTTYSVLVAQSNLFAIGSWLSSYLFFLESQPIDLYSVESQFKLYAEYLCFAELKLSFGKVRK